MAKTKIGVSIDDEIAYEIDNPVDECTEFRANRSEIVEAVLKTYLESDLITNHGFVTSLSAGEKVRYNRL